MIKTTLYLWKNLEKYLPDDDSKTPKIAQILIRKETLVLFSICSNSRFYKIILKKNLYTFHQWLP